MVSVQIRPNDFGFRSLYNHPDNPRIEMDFYDDEGGCVEMIVTRHFAGQIIMVLQNMCDDFDNSKQKKE